MCSYLNRNMYRKKIVNNALGHSTMTMHGLGSGSWWKCIGSSSIRIQRLSCQGPDYFLANEHKNGRICAHFSRATKRNLARKKTICDDATCGRACMTVSSRARIPFAIFSSLSTLAIRSTLITRMIVGLIGNTCIPCYLLLNQIYQYTGCLKKTF